LQQSKTQEASPEAGPGMETGNGILSSTRQIKIELRTHGSSALSTYSLCCRNTQLLGVS